jgi:hypothetical protein
MLHQQDAADSQITVKISTIGFNGTLSFAVDHQGLSWVTDSIDLSDLQFIARDLKRHFPNLEPFTKGSQFDRVFTMQKKELPANRETLELFMADLVRFEVCRNDLNLRTLLQINEKLEEETTRR